MGNPPSEARPSRNTVRPPRRRPGHPEVRPAHRPESAQPSPRRPVTLPAPQGPGGQSSSPSTGSGRRAGVVLQSGASRAAPSPRTDQQQLDSPPSDSQVRGSRPSSRPMVVRMVPPWLTTTSVPPSGSLSALRSHHRGRAVGDLGLQLAAAAAHRLAPLPRGVLLAETRDDLLVGQPLPGARVGLPQRLVVRDWQAGERRPARRRCPRSGAGRRR